MAKQRAIDLQLIKPIEGRSNGKGKITLNKLQKELLSDLHVPFYDTCCDTNQAPLGSPVRFVGDLEYFNGTAWASIPIPLASRFGVASEDNIANQNRHFDINAYDYTLLSDGTPIYEVLPNGNIYYGQVNMDNGIKHQFGAGVTISDPGTGNINFYSDPFSYTTVIGDYTNAFGGTQLKVDALSKVTTIYNGSVRNLVATGDGSTVELDLGDLDNIVGGAYISVANNGVGTGFIQINSTNFGLNVNDGPARFLSHGHARSNHAAAQTATMTNGPVAGNPTKWLEINDGGFLRWFPVWGNTPA